VWLQAQQASGMNDVWLLLHTTVHALTFQVDVVTVEKKKLAMTRGCHTASLSALQADVGCLLWVVTFPD
jgi:hypothetical protein